MATLSWRRDLGSDISGVKDTFTSWDACMTKAYCKWPAIIGIVVGSLVLLSVVFCAARCLGCCSPRRRRNDGYEQQAPPPQYQQPYAPDQSPPPPTYACGGAGYRGAASVAQTATFDTPTKSYGGEAAKINEDALPAFPSWDHAASKRVEVEDVEMEKLDHAHDEPLISKSNEAFYSSQTDQYANPPIQAAAPEHSAGRDVGATHASPYQDYEPHRQYTAAPISPGAYGQTVHPTPYNSRSPTSRTYEPCNAQQQWVGGGRAGAYADSVAPSYHTYAPPQGPPPQALTVGRRPVPGSLRDL